MFYFWIQDTMYIRNLTLYGNILDSLFHLGTKYLDSFLKIIIMVRQIAKV